jgi:serine/threonine-protein kinase
LAATAALDALVPATASGIEPIEHHVETDPGYRRKQVRRAVIVVAAIIVLVALAAFIWYLTRLVEVPELVGKPLSAAQTFCRDNDLELEVVEEYRMDVEQGVVTAQELVAGENTMRGSTFSLTVSKGPDPDERLVLPDFSTMKRVVAEQWIQDHRADNLRLVQEFSDSVPVSDFLRLEFRGTDVGADNYRRRDYATLYYSKGAEVFEKNITVPDFAGKTRGEVETWAQTNSLELTVEETDSEVADAGTVISQSVAAGEKVAKRDAFAVTVSLGKPIVVPNFANHTVVTAPGAAEQLLVTVQTRFDSSVAYGQLISQSVPSGTKLLPSDDHQVTVVYSEGRPFLKDYRGMSEGDLPAAFFNDYTTKGASVTYELRYVDSSESKGMVVNMSDYSRFIPMSFHVVVDVSRGNLPPTTPTPGTTPDSTPNSTPTVGPGSGVEY